MSSLDWFRMDPIRISRISWNGVDCLIYLPKITQRYGYLKGARVMLCLDPEGNLVLKLLDKPPPGSRA